MQARIFQDVARPSVRLSQALELEIGQWAILHTATGDYAAKVEKLRDFDGHWQVRIYVPALGRRIWQYWNHLQAFQPAAHFAGIGNRVRFLQKNGIVSIGEIIVSRTNEVLVRCNETSCIATPRIALVEIIGRLS